MSIKGNPFTPHPGEEPRVSRGRDEEINLFKGLMKKTVLADGVNDHIVLLGEWGLGKTVLLKQFKATAQAEGYPAFFCPISKFSENADVASGLELLTDLMLRQSPMAAKIASKLKDIDITFRIPGISGRSGKKHLHPQIYLGRILQTMWRYLKTELAVVLVDDVHNFSSISSVLDVIRAVLNDDDIRMKTRWIFVFSCMPRQWDEYLHKHDPIGRTFRIRRILKKLTNNEVREIIQESLSETGVSFDDEVIDRVFNITGGHPYELQTLCDNLYTSQIKGRVNSSVWETSLEQSLEQLGEAYFKAACNDVSERELPVLKVLGESRSAMSIKDIQKNLKEQKELEFPVDDTKNYVYRLVKERRLVEKVKRGCYQVSDKMLCEFISRRVQLSE